MAVWKHYKILLFPFAFFLIGSQCATVRQKPQTASELFANAQENLKNQRFEEAKQEFKDLIAQYPNSELADDALFRLGYISASQNNYPAAKNYFGTVLSDYPKSDWSFDAKVWFDLLSAWANLNSELENVRSQLGTTKQTTQVSATSGDDASAKVKELQKEIDRLRLENSKLRGIIESGD